MMPSEMNDFTNLALDQQYQGDKAFLFNLIKSYKQGSDKQPVTTSKHPINEVLLSNQVNVAAVTNKSTNNSNTENLSMKNYFANYHNTIANNKHTGQAATGVEHHGPSVNNILGNSARNMEETYMLLTSRCHQKWININNNSTVINRPKQCLYTLINWHTSSFMAKDVQKILHISSLNTQDELEKDFQNFYQSYGLALALVNKSFVELLCCK